MPGHGSSFATRGNPQKVPAKAQSSPNINGEVIDGSARSRYSQGQIKDLVAYTNPQPQMAAQSFGSPLRRVPEIALQPPAFLPPNLYLQFAHLLPVPTLRVEPLAAPPGLFHTYNAASEAIETFEDRSGDHAQPRAPVRDSR